MVHKMNGSVARKERQLDAIDAQAERDKLSPESQLNVLDARLGVGIGAVKERARLHKQMKGKRKPKAAEKLVTEIFAPVSEG